MGLLLADDDLHVPRGVPQVEEDHATVVAAAGHPAGEGDGGTGVGRAQRAGVVGAKQGSAFRERFRVTSGRARARGCARRRPARGRTSWESVRDGSVAAATLPRTCSTLRAPGMTAVTPGWSMIQRSAKAAVGASPAISATSRAAATPDVEGHAGEGLTDVEGLAVPVEVPVVVGGERRRLVVLPGQQPAGQRHAGEDADPGAGGGRQQLLQRLAPEDVEDHLDRLHARVLQRGQPLGDGLDRDAVGGDRLLGDQRVEGVVHPLVGVDRRRRAVQLDQVEGLDAEVAARPVDPGPQVLGRVLGGLERVGAAAGLGRHERPVRPGRQRLADALLRPPVAVDVGGVEQGHPGVEGGVEHVGGGVVVDVAPVAAELPGAQPDDADVGTGAPERPLFHRGHCPTVSRTASNSFPTGTGCCSPVRRSLSWPTPSARSRSPMTTTCEAPDRSAAFIAPLSPRSP